jgi:hypothetical protein
LGSAAAGATTGFLETNDTLGKRILGAGKGAVEGVLRDYVTERAIEGAGKIFRSPTGQLLFRAADGAIMFCQNGPMTGWTADHRIPDQAAYFAADCSVAVAVPRAAGNRAKDTVPRGHPWAA